LSGQTAVLENKVKQLENRLSCTKSSNSFSDETIISEDIYRQAKSCNIIMFNAPEPYITLHEPSNICIVDCLFEDISSNGNSLIDIDDFDD